MKSTIRSIIIDDEPANQQVLQNLLGRYCHDVSVVGSACSAEEGYSLIREQNPDLVFLDIRMPGRSGFDMLRSIGEIRFDVIFISGFDEYAIQAFEFNAVDYVLKPIDYTRLVKAVARATERISRKKERNDPIIHFVHSLDERSHFVRKITLHRNEKVHVVNLNEIVHISAAGTYCEVTTTDSLRFVSARTLGDYEVLLSPFDHFFRVSKSMLINLEYISHYTKGSACFITMKHTACEIEVSRRRKTDLLAALQRIQIEKKN